jgi:hypothetical protein
MIERNESVFDPIAKNHGDNFQGHERQHLKKKERKGNRQMSERTYPKPEKQKEGGTRAKTKTKSKDKEKKRRDTPQPIDSAKPPLFGRKTRR